MGVVSWPFPHVPTASWKGALGDSEKGLVLIITTFQETRLVSVSSFVKQHVR